jgi:hypothetical protein
MSSNALASPLVERFCGCGRMILPLRSTSVIASSLET